MKRLTTSAGTDSEPSWSADGRRIAFTSWRSGQIHVYTMSSTGGPATRLTNTYIDSQPVYSHWQHGRRQGAGCPRRRPREPAGAQAAAIVLAEGWTSSYM